MHKHLHARPNRAVLQAGVIMTYMTLPGMQFSCGEVPINRPCLHAYWWLQRIQPSCVHAGDCMYMIASGLINTIITDIACLHITHTCWHTLQVSTQCLRRMSIATSSPDSCSSTCVHSLCTEAKNRCPGCHNEEEGGGVCSRQYLGKPNHIMCSRVYCTIDTWCAIVRAP